MDVLILSQRRHELRSGERQKLIHLSAGNLPRGSVRVSWEDPFGNQISRYERGLLMFMSQ